MSIPTRPRRVAPTALSALAATAGARDASSAGSPIAESWGSVEVTGVCLRSGDVRPGDLYAALPGERTHGARFAADAERAGAVAVLTDVRGAALTGERGLPVLVVDSPRAVLGEVAAQVYGRPAEAMALVGVTGTQGKTTTTQLLYGALRGAGRRSAVIGTMGAWVDGAAADTSLTTPEAPDLHAMLAVMRERDVEVCAMEVSSHALVLHRVDGVVFDVAVFLDFGRDHLDFHGTVEEYFAAKASLFEPERARLALLNVDDPAVAGLRDRLRIPVRTFSPSGRPADWSGTLERSRDGGSEFRVVGPDGRSRDAFVAMPGAFNVTNGLACLASAAEAGFDLDRAVEGLAGVGGVAGRMERIDEGQRFAVIVDYAHKPDAVHAVLDALRPVTSGRLWIVIGAGGDRDSGKRPLMGEAAARLADVVVVTDDNPRSEDPAAIRAEILRGARAVAGGVSVVEVGDRREAIAFAVCRAEPGDAVVVAGKGHETGQRIGEVTVAFDDRAVVRELLRDLVTTRGALAVIAMTLSDIADVVQGTVQAADGGVVVSGEAFVDSRRPVAEGLFVAIGGEQVDGHDYAATAVGAGAAAALVSRPLGVASILVPDVVAALGRLATAVLERLPGMAVVGVTGSQGKTSTKDLLGAVLADVAPTIAPDESMNNEIGVPVTVLRVDEETRFLVVEMGARGIGHIAHLCAMVSPQTGVVLNVGQAHLGEFGSRDAIAQAKGELVEALPQQGLAVLNADDPRVDAMADRTAARVLRFGTGGRADLRHEVLGLDSDARVTVRLAWHGRESDVATQYVGAHQAANIAAAATAALGLGVGFADVCQSLRDARPASHWRMEVTSTAAGVTVVNDAYNANPDSVRAALDAAVVLARGHGATRLVVVLGEMHELGASSADAHRAVGVMAAEHGAGLVVAVGDAARPVADGAAAVPGWPGRVEVADGVESALDLLRVELREGDLLLVKASRAEGFERLAAGLVETLGVAGQHDQTGGDG